MFCCVLGWSVFKQIAEHKQQPLSTTLISLIKMVILTNKNWKQTKPAINSFMSTLLSSPNV